MSYYIFSIVAVMVALLVVFFLYLKFEEKRKTEVYHSFMSTFRRISEGNMSDRVEKYNIVELDIVGEQFNLMMDSVMMLNKALAEEERCLLQGRSVNPCTIALHISKHRNKWHLYIIK